MVLTTHWAFLDQLKADDSIEVIEERYVQDGKIWSSVGVSAGMDMTLAFNPNVSNYIKNIKE
jgi:cyclohexyl-isocyanide hydratase